MGHVEEVHGFGNVEEGIGIVFETEGFSLVVEVGFDEEFRTKGWGADAVGGFFWFGGGAELATKAEVPFWTRAIGDRCNF